MAIVRKRLPSLIELLGKKYRLSGDTIKGFPEPGSMANLDWDSREALKMAQAEGKTLARVGFLERELDTPTRPAVPVSKEQLDKHSLLFEPIESLTKRQRVNHKAFPHEQNARVKVFERMTGRKAMKLRGGSYLIRALLATAALGPLLSQMRSKSDSD